MIFSSLNLIYFFHMGNLFLQPSSKLKVNLLNPKRCGLFGQLRRRGGIKVSHFRIMVSGGLNFHSSYTNSTSYESWHIQLIFETSVRSLRLIVWPQEVTEVTEVKMKKKNRRKLKNRQFLTHRNVIYLKRSLMKIAIQIWNEIVGFRMYKLKKNRFCDFRPQKIIIFYWSRPNF